MSGPARKVLDRLTGRGVLTLVWCVLRAVTSQLAKTPKDPHGPSKTVGEAGGFSHQVSVTI
jgi:hypothetical protein